MSGDRERYPSVPERITWTTGFRQPIDKHILGVLSTFANFRTGKHADMYLDTLVERAKVERRRVIRSLGRLKADQWIFAKPRHRRPTVYDINVDRLATHWMEAKLAPPLSDTGVTLNSGLSDTGVTQEVDRLSDTGDRLGDTGVTQEPILSDTGVTPRSPVRTDPQFDHKEPALRAVPSDAADTMPPALSATDEAKGDEAKGPPRVLHQLAFGPLVSDDERAPPARDSHWQRFAETLRTALKKHG
jgi:hypothetical protein